MGDDRPSVYMEDGKAIYRASGFGACIKELVALRTAHLSGFQPAPWPTKFTKIFADGHRGEDVIIARMEADGWEITNRQYEINWEVLPGVIIRGHIDGTAEHENHSSLVPYIFDAKTTSAKYGIAASLLTKYDLQLSIYGHALGLDAAVLGVGIKDPKTGDVVSHQVHGPEPLAVSVAQIKARLAKIESLAKHYEETGDYPTCDEKQYPCSAFHLHHGRGGSEESLDPYSVTGFTHTTDTRVQVGVLEDNSLDRHAAEYIAAQVAESEAKARKAAAREAILTHVGGEKPMTTELHQIKFTGTGTRKVLVKDRLEKYLLGLGPGAPKLEDFYGLETASKSIKIDTIGEK